MASPDAVAGEVRARSGVGPGRGPDDAHIKSAVEGFVRAFDYWYIRVVRGAIKKYRTLLVGRINPFIRQLECGTLNARDFACRIVADWNNRNFVTAGGWALEELALCIGTGQKSSAEGIDVQRRDPASGDYHLYVMKSGTVTRNSDILKSLKRNARQAEKLLLQGGRKGSVHAYYAIAAGKTTSTFEDGIHRPASSVFWSHMTDLPEKEALDLVFAIVQVAGQVVRTDAAKDVDALVTLVQDYIAHRDDPTKVDWEFLVRRTMREKIVWAVEDKARHRRAQEALRKTGYKQDDTDPPR